MNWSDEIKCKTRDTTSNVHTNPVARDAMADQLIELIDLMVTVECCRTDSKPHVCHIQTGACCYPNSEVCPDHG